MREVDNQALRVSTNHAETRIKIWQLGRAPGHPNEWHVFELTPTDARNFAEKLLERANDIEMVAKKREISVVLETANSP